MLRHRRCPGLSGWARISYYLREVELEYGQPFSDLRDAEEFVRAYTMPMEKEELDAYLRKYLSRQATHNSRTICPRKAFGLVCNSEDENAQF